MDPNSLLFLGRFHPLIVHLPIGFLILALLFQLVERLIHKEFSILEHAIRYALFLGAITALMAVTSGWILAGNGRYGSDSLVWHRWGGVSVGILAFLAWAIKSGMIRIHSSVYSWNMVFLGIVLMATGHWGGSLTHGDGYLLEYAPSFIRQLAMSGSDTTQQNFLPANPDSVQVYTHLIRPVLKSKCMPCHNSDEKRGGLDMTSTASLMEGGEEGKTIVPGDAFESRLFSRVTLPMEHSRFMPPRGDPMSYTEIRMLEWWINEGAPFEGNFSTLEVPADLSAILLEEYHVDLRPRPFYETTKVAPLSPEVLDKITENGFSGSELSEENHYLKLKSEVNLEDPEVIKQLIPARQQITFLDLSGSGISDQPLEWVGKLENLYSLDLSHTPISDLGLVYLKSLDRLAVLNLYGTDITDQGLESIRSLPGLKRVYLWQTGVTKDYTDQWKKERPDLEVVSGE